MKSLFHVSLPCANIEKTIQFYTKTLGYELGRKAQQWVDVDLFGHQLTFSEAGKYKFENPSYFFEGKVLPSFHLGVIVDLETWTGLFKKLSEIDSHIVHQKTFLVGKKGEHLSFFVNDPDGYNLEIKSFRNENEIFAF